VFAGLWESWKNGEIRTRSELATIPQKKREHEESGGAGRKAPAILA
jgi:hypothetical protein